MTSTKQNVQDIIRAASFACDGIAGASPDAEEIARIQTDMIMAIASEHGAVIDKAAAADLLLRFTATMQNFPVLSGRQSLVGWLPGIDNNPDDTDSTAAALTEAIGWTANSHFEQTGAK